MTRDRVSSCWWQMPGSLLPGSLRINLLRLDGQIGAAVNAEKQKQMDAPGVGLGKVAEQLERVAQQMGLGVGNGVVEQADRELSGEPVKPGFTREAGSFRRQSRRTGFGI